MRYVLLLLLLVTLSAQASDYAREKRWAEEITPTLVVGDAVYLKAMGHQFLSLYAPAKHPKGAVVLVHGVGVNPDWGLIGVLRSELPDHGYTTLSLQMPVLAANAKLEAYTRTFPEAAARIAAGVAYLRAHGYVHIALVSHSLGSRMSDYYLAHHPQAPLQTWIAIGMPSAYTATRKLHIPMLDLYGAEDLPAVKASAPARAKEIAHLPNSLQIQVPDTDHFFDGRDAQLVKIVSDFLDALGWPAAK